MTVSHPPRARRKGTERRRLENDSWEQLGFLEQNLLLAALAEKPLWVTCAGVEGLLDGDSVVALRLAARRLVDLGLIWFYRVEEGYPDLTPAEADELCADDRHWDPRLEDCTSFGLYLTEHGEGVMPVTSRAPAEQHDAMSPRR